jgi:hypothetical protein
MTKYVPNGRAGDIVGCLNGHDMYRLLADVTPGAVIESSIFEPIGDAPKPECYKPIAPCHVCGMPWVAKGPAGGWVLCNVRTKL